MSNLTKVTLATAILVMLVAGLLFTNHRTAQTAGAISAHIATYALPKLDNLHDMRFGVARIVSSMNELLVLSAARQDSVQNDPSKRQQETRFINSGRKLFETAFTLFKDRNMLHDNAENHGYLPLINDIEGEYLALMETSNLIINVSKNPFDPIIVSKLKDVFENREQKLLNSIDKTLTIGRAEIQVLLVKEMNAVETMDFQTITLGGIFFATIIVYVLFVLITLSSESKARTATERAILEKDHEMAQRIQLEKNLAHLHKLESLGTLAGGMAHELNNQLQPIMTMSELIFDKLQKDDPDYRKVEIILAGTQNARTTVSRILKYARSGEGPSKSCNIRNVFNMTKDILDAGCPANVQFKLITDGSDGSVQMAADDFLSVLVNLFSNAVDAIAEQQGQITINCEKQGDSSLNLNPKAHYKITVQDNGCGMPASLYERIFDPFFTTKVAGKGIGLGMSIVHSTVTEANGQIFVESEEGVGTIFKIYLPLVDTSTIT